MEVAQLAGGGARIRTCNSRASPVEAMPAFPGAALLVPMKKQTAAEALGTTVREIEPVIDILKPEVFSFCTKRLRRFVLLSETRKERW